MIRADGGSNATYSGGGGRIALAVTNAGADFSMFAGVFSARGWGAPPYGRIAGGAGTVYLRTADRGIDEGTLIVDNGSLAAVGHTEINSDVTGCAVGDVIVRNKGVLVLFTNQSLAFGGIWSNSAGVDAQEGSRVIVAGGPASTSVFYGATTFMGLICTNAGGKIFVRSRQNQQDCSQWPADAQG